MSRLLSVATAALVFGTVAASAADATDRLILRVNGHITGVGANVDQSLMGDLDEWVGAVDTGLFGSAVLPLDGGGEIGGRIALDLDYSTHVDTFLNDAGSSDVLEELWLYWEGRYGRVQVGLMDGAADVLGLSPPSVSSAIRVDNPEVYLLAFPCLEPSCSSDPGDPGSLFNPNGMQLRSDVHGSDNFLKIMYVTPVFDGIRIAISYTPDGSRDLDDLFGPDEQNEQANIIDIAANYAGTLGDVDVGLSIGYVFGDNVNNQDTTPPDAYGDLEDFGAAAKLGYREWTLGAAYRQTNVAGGGPVVQHSFLGNVFEDQVTEAWSFGLMYETGPWAASVNFITMTEELPFDEQEGSGLQVALGYTINENFRVTGGYQRYDFESDFGFCGFGFCDTLDANVGYIETSFNF